MAALLLAGFLIPETLVIPVSGATPADWNEDTFWYEPWGASGVHKGIDIFGTKGTPAVAASGGIVVFSGSGNMGGNYVVVLGPKWRLHYYAHLDTASVSFGDWLSRTEQLGTVGDTGNAAGKPPHLHYTILSLVPLPWLMTSESQGWKRMFFLDPDARLR